MRVPPAEADEFHRIYANLLSWTAIREKLCGIRTRSDYDRSDLRVVDAVRQHLYANRALLETYAASNPHQEDPGTLEIVRRFRHALCQRFVVVRDLKKYTVFLDESTTPPRALGVLGLHTEIDEMLPRDPPVMVDATLLPWKQGILADGLLRSLSISFGPGIRRSFAASYREARERGILVSFDSDGEPRAQAPSRAPRRPAPSPLERFLAKGLDTPAKVEVQYGPPAARLEGEGARRLLVRDASGGALHGADTVLVYTHVLRGHQLYLFVSGGAITHAQAVPRRRPRAGARADGAR